MKGVDLAMNHSNVKPTTKKRARAVLSVFLVVAILIAGAYAFLSATDSKTNVFTVGNVDIELHEIFNGKDYGKGEDPGAIGDKIENIVPGQSIEKAPYVVNTGKNPAYTFIAVGIPTDTSANVYNGQGTYTAKTELDIKVKAYAIQQQYNGATDAESTWTNYFKNDMISGTASDAGIELFTLNDGTSAVTTGTHTIGSDWQEFSTPYSVTDGGNTYTYHFFKYVANNELLPVGTTTAHLFDKVIFNEDIGGDEPKNILFTDSLPEDCKFVTSEGDEYTAGETIPEDYVKKQNDVFEDNDYIYTYYESIFGIEKDTGWRVKVKDNTKTSYNEMYSYIDAEPVTHLYETFKDCTNLIEAPKISVTATRMNGTFQNCTSLTVAPTLPDSLEEMDFIFSECKSLKQAPRIPTKVTNMNYAFSGCSTLEIAPALPLGQYGTGNIGISGAFNCCPSLTEAPTIPNGVTDLQHTFYGCSSLVKAPIIPNTVEVMNCTFTACSALTEAPAIPENVRDVSQTFDGCVNLAGTIEVNCNPTLYNLFLSGTHITEVVGTTTMASVLLYTK